MRCGHCYAFTGRASEVLAHQRGGCSVDKRWGNVVVARLAGRRRTADRIARRILGVVKPMSEEAKAKLRDYNQTHKEEIRNRRKVRRGIRTAMRARVR